MNKDKLRGLMAERRLTAQDMADLLHMNYYTFIGRMGGRSEFRVSEIIILADFFGVGTDIFLPSLLVK